MEKNACVACGNDARFLCQKCLITQYCSHKCAQTHPCPCRTRKEPPLLEEAKFAAKELGIDWANRYYGLDDLRKGMVVEMEHGLVDPDTNVTYDDPLLTAKIALAHLNEHPLYYEYLERMEKELEKIPKMRIATAICGNGFGINPDDYVTVLGEGAYGVIKAHRSDNTVCKFFRNQVACGEGEQEYKMHLHIYDTFTQYKNRIHPKAVVPRPVVFSRESGPGYSCYYIMEKVSSPRADGSMVHLMLNSSARSEISSDSINYVKYGDPESGIRGYFQTSVPEDKMHVYSAMGSLMAMLVEIAAVDPWDVEFLLGADDRVWVVDFGMVTKRLSRGNTAQTDEISDLMQCDPYVPDVLGNPKGWPLFLGAMLKTGGDLCDDLTYAHVEEALEILISRSANLTNSMLSMRSVQMGIKIFMSESRTARKYKNIASDIMRSPLDGTLAKQWNPDDIVYEMEDEFVRDFLMLDRATADSQMVKEETRRYFLSAGKRRESTPCPIRKC